MHPASLCENRIELMSPDVDFPSDLRSLESEYELIREIGQGGMAAVYLARHRASGQVVAIKAVRARYLDDPDALRRFAREARTVAGLDHPNIVRTVAIEQMGDRAVAIIMEHVAGGTVRDRLREFGSLGAEEAESILRDVANALGYAHRHGIVHRDVKPENIFLDPTRRRALLSDFGIARPIDSDAGIITLLGASLGTPQYMSPEQIDGELVDGRSDIYSLGVLGWELLTGRRPWAGENLYGIIYKQKHEDLPRITSLRPRVPANLLFAIEGALIKDKDRRWQTTDAFLEQLTYNPPPLLSQTYPPGPERVDDEPTVQFRRPKLVEGEPASVAPPESAVDGEEATAIVPAVSSGELPVVDAHVPPVELVEPAAVPDRMVSARPVPNEEAPFAFVSGRRRALQVAGLLVPLGIAAAAMFVLLSGNTPGRVDRRAVNVTASDGSIAPDSAVPAPVAIDSRGSGSLAASPPPTTAGRSTLTESRPARIPTPKRRPIATARPRTAVSPGASRPRDTTTHGTRPESSRVVASRPPNDSNGGAVVAPKPEVPAETKAAPPPVDDPFKIPGGGDARVRGAPTGAVPSPRCRLASTADQQACLSAYIAAGDVPLDHAFASLVDEMRRVARTPPGAPDPVTVQRVRVEQRAWMSIRNSECPRSAPAGAGPFWAGAQADCFTEMATARAAELRDAVKRLKKR
jgi:serine/threonine protein kinase/uncharacterized protein YecT (DUF1311 family)